jgi:hypothetical protein
MAKKRPSISGILVCSITGEEFEYRGYGRPPKYSPAARDEIVRQQREKARARAKAKRHAAKSEKSVQHAHV